MSWSSKIKSIISIGLPLENIGIKNWALNRAQALATLEEFQKHGIAVLGGDVYEMLDGALEPNYDNWYCEQNNEESFLDFSKRSIIDARTYLNNYDQNKKDTIYFTFVAQENQDE